MALEEVLQRIYEKNPFINLLQMKMESGTGEGALFSMPIISGIHTNLHGNAHGGAIFSWQILRWEQAVLFIIKRW